jgi:REP element-mobilizing transposase RayT
MKRPEEDIEVRKVNLQEDHVYIVIIIKLGVSVARAIKYMKSVSGAGLNEKFGFMKKQ